MASWAEAMSTLNLALLAEFPDTLIFKSASYNCIAPPIERLKKMTQGPYDANATASFQMLESDRATAGIEPRSTIISNGLTFEVYSIESDANDSTVRLRCNLKQ